MRRTFLLLLLFPLTLGAQEEPRRWALHASFGEVTMGENKADNERYFPSEDKGNAFSFAADYFLTSRLALTGGLVFEQQGLFTDFSSGIGLKKANQLGVVAGAKYYFFPKKWIVQPHVGGMLHTNVLNLSRYRGESRVVLSQGYPGSHGQLSYDVQCPALSIAPSVGVDIRLVSSLSLTLSYDYRFGLWGHHRGDLRLVDGPLTGNVVRIDESFQRSGISLGLRMDFPVRSVSRRTQNNLLMLLYGIFETKANRR